MPLPRVLLLAATASLLAAGCKPDSITAARDQLGRGPSRTVQFTVPIAIDTITIGQFLAGDDSSSTDTATTPSGVRAVRFDPESLTVDVGDNLQFDGITFDGFTFSYDQMLRTQQIVTSLSLPAPPAGAPRPSAPFLAVMATPDTVVFDTPGGSRVDGASIASGYIVRTLTNNTNCDATVTVALTDANNATVVSFPAAPVPQGTTFTDSVSAAGANVSQFVSVNATADLGLCVPSAGNVAADFTFRPLTLASVTLSNVNETFTENYAALASETRLQAIDTVAVESGTLAITVDNRLPIALNLDLTVQGITVGGATLQRSFLVPAAPGDGSVVQSTVNIDMAGAVIVPGVVLAVAEGTAAAPSATITPTVATNAVAVNGGGALAVERLVGVLDPAQTPELTIAVESTQEIGSGSIDFGDFEDAIRGSTINEAVFTFQIANGLQTPITLDRYTVGLAITDGAGNPRRDGLGGIIYETDSLGAPILLTIAQPGDTALLLPSGGNADVELTTAAPLLDRLVHLVLDDSSVALIGAGSAVVGDGVTLSRIEASDAVVINLDLLVGLDITIPDTGVVFSQTQEGDGLGLDDADAEDLASRLVAATATSVVTNGIPYGVEVTIAVIAGSYGDSVDVFTLPGHTVFSSVSLGAATVNPATGRTTAPTTGTVEQQLTGANSRPLFGETFTATVRIRIRPPSGSSGRGAVVSGDPLILDARAAVSFTSGGAQ